MGNWSKNIWLKLFSAFDIKQHVDFNFEKYIKEIGFDFISEKDGLKIYINNYSETVKIHILFDVKKEEISIINKGRLCTRINFIPKGSLFVDLLLNQTINNLEKNNTEDNVR